MSKIEFSSGYAVLKPFVDRKTSREYKNVLFKAYVGEELEADFKNPSDKEVGKKIKYKFNPDQAEELNDVLVLGLVQELFVDGKNVPVNLDSFNALSEEDFNKIALACNEMKTKKETKEAIEEKKNLIRKVKNAIGGRSKHAPVEYVDYLLIKHLYHCTPEELDNQDEHITSLHVDFMNIEAELQQREANRSQQRMRNKK